MFSVEIFWVSLATSRHLSWISEFRFQETQRLVAEPVPGIKAEPHEENARYFKVIIDGPKDVSGLIVDIYSSLIAAFIVNHATYKLTWVLQRAGEGI